MTLELSNVANLPITIYPGMKIGQISFMQMTEPAATPYGSAAIGSKYKGQRGPTAEPLLAELRGLVTVLVTGGTGFIGPHVVHALRAARLRRARARARSPTRATRLTAWGVELATGDVTDPASLRAACEGVDTVVHLVAIIKGTPADFERVMSQGTRNVVAAAQDAGVRRFVLASALGLDERTKDAVPYFAAKWEMERAVRESGLEHVIFRPSFVFGRDGGVLPTFVRLARFAPVTPIIGSGTQRLQPIWVEDLAEYYARAVDEPAATNRTFELGGPDAVTLERVLGAPEASARRAAAVDPRPVRRDARPGDGDRAAARRAGHARPAHDARARRQRRHRPERRRDVPAAARLARRAAAARDVTRGVVYAEPDAARRSRS